MWRGDINYSGGGGGDGDGGGGGGEPQRSLSGQEVGPNEYAAGPN